MESYAKKITLDWAKVGTMLVVSHLLSGGSVTDQDWLKSSLYILLGFSAYEGLVAQLIDTTQFGQYGPVVHTILKVGTMLLVSRLLSGGSVTDQTWLLNTLYTLLGFALYVIFIHKRISGSMITDNRDLANSLDDALNFGTMFLVSRAIQRDSLTDRSWLMDSLYTIVGYVSYDLVVSRVISMVGIDPHSGTLPAHAEHHA